MASFIGFLMFLAIIGLGVLLPLGGIWWLVQQNLELLRYNETDAEIRTAEIRAHTPWFASSKVDSKTPGDSPYGVEPHIKYSYQVEGEEYTSTRLWPYGIAPIFKRLTMQNKNFATTIVEHFSSGEEITAYYHPANPDKAFLFRERDFFGPILLLVLGGAVLGYLNSIV